MTTIVRRYRADDASSVRACIVVLQDFERTIDERLRPGETMADAYLDQMLARCHDWSGAILVAECDGEIAGFATVLTHVPYESLDDPPGDYALISDLAVRDAFRRRGLATALLQEAERYARAAGATELRVGVLSANDAADRLYRRKGFEPYLLTLMKRLD